MFPQGILALVGALADLGLDQELGVVLIELEGVVQLFLPEVLEGDFELRFRGGCPATRQVQTEPRLPQEVSRGQHVRIS